jgi:hypothetical protein
MKAGVIACGAGISPYGGAEQLDLPFYIGIAGRMDMNFIDVVTSVQKARIRGTPAWMISFGGGHFWPDTASFSRAFDQVLIHWQEKELTGIPEKETERICRDMQSQLDSLLTADRHFEIKLMEANLAGHPLFDPGDSGWGRLTARIPTGGMEKKTDREWAKIQKREMAYIDTILSAMEGINMALYNQMDKLRPGSWWKKRRKQVDRVIKSDDALVRESGYRMFDFTVRSCLSWGYTHLEDPLEPEQAARYFRAWCSFDPESAEAFYWLAGAYGASGQDRKALQSLKKALDNGFNRVDRIEKAEAFEALRSDPDYRELIRRIKTD